MDVAGAHALIRTNLSSSILQTYPQAELMRIYQKHHGDYLMASTDQVTNTIINCSGTDRDFFQGRRTKDTKAKQNYRLNI